MVYGRKLLVGALLLLALMISGGVNAQALGIHASPETGTFTLRLPNGTIITADAVSRRFYLSDSTGAFTEVTFDEAISHAEPDPAQRAALMAAFESALTNPIASGYQAHHPAQPSPSPCWDSNECHPNAIGEGEYGTNSERDGDAELPKPIDVPVVVVTASRPSHDPASLGVNYWLGFVGGYSNPGENLSYQRYYADDYRRFQNHQNAACDAASVASFRVGLAIAAGLVSCPAAVASGGTASVLCVVSMFAVVTEWADMAEKEATCSQAYPGPGNW